MSYCATCIDAGKEKNRAMDDRRQEAQQKANEKGEPQAICREETDNIFFVTNAFAAFQQHFLIVEVVSRLPD